MNSDTQITEGSIDEMLNVMKGSDKHGIVCPRTNNGTIQTFPFNQVMEANTSYLLWKKFRYQTCKKYHYIPTAVGFCMLIKTFLFNRYGLFSNEYGFGYNEENDFHKELMKKDIQ